MGVSMIKLSIKKLKMTDRSSESPSTECFPYSSRRQMYVCDLKLSTSRLDLKVEETDREKWLKNNISKQ